MRVHDPPQVRLRDGGYRGRLLEWVAHRFPFVLSVVLLPRRWGVERAFAWFNHPRRLSEGYECLMPTSETWIYLAMIKLMANRLA